MLRRRSCVVVMNACMRSFTTVHFGDFQSKISEKSPSVTDFRNRVATWLHLSNPNVIKLYTLPDQTKDSTKFQQQLQGVKKGDRVINDEDSIDSLSSDVQVVLAVNAKVRTFLNINPVIRIYVADVMSTQGFTMGLRLYMFSYRWDRVIRVSSIDDEIILSRDKKTVNANRLVEMIDKEEVFQLITEKTLSGKIIRLVLLIAVLHFIIYLYLLVF